MAMDGNKPLISGIAPGQPVCRAAQAGADRFFAQGYALQQRGEREQAVTCYAAGLALVPTDANVWRQYLLLLRQLGRLEQALAASETALDYLPTDAALWEERADLLLSLDHDEEAIVTCERTLAMNSKSSTLWHLYGRALANADRFDEALVAYNRALYLDRRNPYIWANRARAYRLLRQYDQALVSAQRGIQVAPNAYGWHALGHVFLAQQQFYAALEVYTLIIIAREIGKEPADALAWINRGVALMGLKRYSEALFAFEQALALDSSAHAWNNVATALVHLRRSGEALPQLERALELNPTFTDAWVSKGEALVALRRPQEALAALDEALKRDDRYGPALVYKGKALTEMGKYAEAKEAFRQALAPDALARTTSASITHAEGAEGLGEVYLLQGYPQAALVALDSALEHDPLLASAWRHKAEALRALGNEQQAQAAAQRADALDAEQQRPLPDVINLSKSPEARLYAQMERRVARQQFLRLLPGYLMWGVLLLLCAIAAALIVLIGRH
ncbi:MAG: tetratricopeptide repeat protein [Ktedonobacterales bacterium]